MNRQQRRAAAKVGRSAVGGKAGDVQPTRRDMLLAEAVKAYQAARFREASAACRQLLALDRRDIAALHLTGLLALQAGRNDTAVEVLTAAIRVSDQISDLHGALAEALQRLDRLDEAVVHYQRALALDPSYLDALYNYSNVLLKLRRYDDAVTHYDRALALVPRFAEAFNNRGHALFELGRPRQALADFEQALAIKPDFAAALANRGTALIEHKQYEEGVASCTAALALNPTETSALANRGNGLFELRRYAEAARDFEGLLAIDPDYPYAAGKALYCRLLSCDWAHYQRDISAIAATVQSGGRAAIPFMFLNMADSAAAHLQCAVTFSRDKYPAAAEPLWRGERYAHERIRIAYLSADFRQHPMAYAMAGVFDAHDRSRFETIAISFGPDPQDPVRRRLETAFDCFRDVRTMVNRDIARLLRELEVDIAVDLMGYTNNSRPGILAFRPAPVQVNYIGFAGTFGTEYIDYLIADRFIVPEAAQASYAEQVVYLPDTYWPTDNRVRIGEPRLGRAEAGLPGEGFVFCCFNQNYKIAPPIFDVWMNLLRQVDGSALWLVRDNADAERNLRQQAEKRGIAPQRLVFAPRVPIDEYLARFRLADLFLDTLPFNAHTTAADALWAGLPLVTCSGSSFAARVAGSLLTAVGLSELIATSLPEYEALALSLAREPEHLAGIRARLAHNRDTFPLFDTNRFTRHIESAYRTMWHRYQNGEPPAGFTVAPLP
jgi:predicted O-linked N-acetylglucosamine transferase (SPINDLY family)